MEKSTINFTHLIYNQEKETIAFIHLGRPSFTERLKYHCEPCNINRTNYAFKPRNMEEFLFFLENTELTPTRNYSDLSFKSFRIRPSKDIEDPIAFNWVATRFASKFTTSPDDLRIFIHKCNIIKQYKLSNQKKNTIERE